MRPLPLILWRWECCDPLAPRWSTKHLTTFTTISQHLMMSLQTSFSQTFDSCHISSIQMRETETQIQIVSNCCWCQVVGRELRGHMTAMKKIAVGEWMPAGFVQAKKVATGEIRWLFMVNLCETMWNYCTLNRINLIFPPLKLTVRP